MPVPVKHIGPFAGGVVDAQNPIFGVDTVVRYARNAVLDGLGQFQARRGSQVALTLKDDQGTPAVITSVVALVQFGDAALAVGHSTVTSKFYLYWLKADLTDWYNISKALQGTTTVLPVGVLWSAIATSDLVLIAEGLGFAYIAHNVASTTFKTMQFDTTQTPAVLGAFQANLNGAGVADTFFRGVVSFQQHLWGWGYGSQTAGDNDRPELLRFSTPFFGAMAQNDNFAVGHRVRSVREKVVLAMVAGEVLYAGTNFSIWPIVGFGRNSWDKSRPIDDSYGFAGPRAACAGPNGYLYYWSHRGPLRVRGYGPPDPLWPRIATTIKGVVNEQTVIAQYDSNTDQVVWLYQDGASGRISRLCAYDAIRETFLGPDGDVGLGVAVAAFINPVFATAAPGPAGAPTTASTTDVGTTVATAHWVNGDTSPETVTQLEYRTPQGSGGWTVATSTIASGVTSYQITGLTGLTAYEWRAKHIRNGIASAYLGPVAGSQFTTIGQLAAPTAFDFSITGAGPLYPVTVSWVNSGESGVSTEVYIQEPGFGYVLYTTRAPGVSSYSFKIDTLGTWNGKVRHVRSGSTASNYSNVDSVTIP